MKDAFLNVAAFERLCGHELPDDEPGSDSTDLLQLRIDLIDEESRETTWALSKGFEDIHKYGVASQDTVAEIADGLADTIFVCIGTAIRLGIDLPEVWNRVCEANLKKFGPGSRRREDGKILKPESWQPPDILGVIKNQKTLRELYQNGLTGGFHSKDDGDV